MLRWSMMLIVLRHGPLVACRGQRDQTLLCSQAIAATGTLIPFLYLLQREVIDLLGEDDRHVVVVVEEVTGGRAMEGQWTRLGWVGLG